MGETLSPTDENLFLLDGLDSFAKHALQLITQSRRQLYILSTTLDFPLLNNTAIESAMSQFARRDRNTSIQILVKQSRPLVERNHALLLLARRLPSKISIRRLTIEPENDDRAYIIGDKDLLLCKHDDREYLGFANYRAGPEASNFLEEFAYLWQLHSSEDADLRTLTL